MVKPMDDDESVVESGVVDRRKRTGRVTGNVDASGVGIRPPSATPRRQGTERVQAGVRPGGPAPSERVQQRRETSRQVVRQTQDEHRQRVWDKLDAAKRSADEKAARLKSFEPPGAAIDEDEEF